MPSSWSYCMIAIGTASHRSILPNSLSWRLHGRETSRQTLERAASLRRTLHRAAEVLATDSHSAYTALLIV
ncbi:hypothetical protein BGZ63DRAFT_383826, partial [Mariannaea sp. PMI_226]